MCKINITDVQFSVCTVWPLLAMESSNFTRFHRILWLKKKFYKTSVPNLDLWGFNVMLCQVKHGFLCHQGNLGLLLSLFMYTGQPVGNSDINDRQASQWLLVPQGSLSQLHRGLCLCTQFIYHYQTSHRSSVHTCTGRQMLTPAADHRELILVFWDISIAISFTRTLNGYWALRFYPH